MTDADPDDRFTLAHVEGRLWVAHRAVGLASYDLDFAAAFGCRHLARLDGPITAVARIGAVGEYDARFARLAGRDVTLVNAPDEYRRATQLPHWYPLLEPMTPRSVWYDRLPTPADVERDGFRWPVFVKGERQTHGHSRRQSIVESPERFAEVMAEWSADPVLAWQRVAVRAFVPLRPVGPTSEHALPPSFEFRTFWYRGRCGGAVDVDGGLKNLSDSTVPSRRTLCVRVSRKRRDASARETQAHSVRRGRGMGHATRPRGGYAGVPRRELWRRVIEATP